MDFLQNEGQRELAALSRDILSDRCTPERLREVEAGGDRFDPGLWAELARARVLAAALPQGPGGAGLGLLEQCSVLTEIGRAVAPAPFLASIVLGAGALAAFGTPAQQELAARAGRGDIVLTAALAEEDGDDPRAPAGSAERMKGQGDEDWRLTGVKTAVPAAMRAGLFLVPAATAEGTVVFLVAPDDPGVTLEPQQLVDTDAAGRLELDGAEVPADRVLGGPAAGARITDWLLARATVGLCAQQLGILERALELTADYAKDRVAFGRPIGIFQAVTQRLADASIDVEAVRLTMWQAAWRLVSGLPAETEVATAKFWAADAGHRVAHPAMHVPGGGGS